MSDKRWNQRGQTATEYALIVAVVVLGLLMAVSFLLPKVKAGVDQLGQHVENHLSKDLVFCDPTKTTCTD